MRWVPGLKALAESGRPLPDGILLASPANPTGVVMNDEAVREVCDWCHQNGVRLIMDEIYHGLTFGRKTATALAFSESVIVVNSFSKYFCMTGWRVGWAIFPDDLLETVERLAQNLYIGHAKAHAKLVRLLPLTIMRALRSMLTGIRKPRCAGDNATTRVSG